MTRWLRRNGDVVVLLVLAYLPTLTAAVGRVPADTKLYLFLDPARLMSEATLTWDPQQFAGWVPHQTILYLWPSGPWFWVMETLTIPDWVAQRLWVGTLLFAAGMGARRLARTFGFAPLAAAVVAVVYQLSPYVLPYISRTSVMLLPWAGLGWIVAYTVRAATTGRWRPALAASLVVLTVAPVNATATAMIAPAPVLWLLVATWQGLIPWRRALQTAVRIGVVSLGLSLWWLVKLAQQGRFGADVLSYSETLEAVSATSTSTEVLRGLGYWLFYVRDPYIATTTAADAHMTSGRVVLASFLLVVVGMVGLVAVRWGARAYAASLVAVGTVLAIGAHPIDDMSALQRFVYGDPRSGLSLGFRSSSRAAPLIVLGLSLAAGALVAALRARERRAATPHRWSMTAALTIVLLAVVNLPALRTGGYVDEALLRDQDPPAAWTHATAALDADSDGGRVMQLPGQESAAFRWGYTVDPPLAGLTDRPIITREWLPLGSPALMDLSFAFNDRIQSGVLEPAAVAPIARLLGVDTIWVTGDIAYDRFGTARPEPLLAALTGAPGLDAPRAFGPRIANVTEVPVIDEALLGDPSASMAVPVVSLIDVQDPTGLVRARTATILLAGSGDGVIDAAGAGLLDGDELVRYLAHIDPDDRREQADRATLVLLTDSNRIRAHHWRSSQDVVGFTEDGTGTDVLALDIADQRLPVFPGVSTDDATIAVQNGPVRARATAYGTPLVYRPEDRAAMAIDGDPTTAWRVADRADPIGQAIRLDVDSPVDSIRVVQPLGSMINRWISTVDVVLDPGTPEEETVTVPLDATSRTKAGQTVALPRSVEAVQFVIVAVETRDRPELSGVDGVGFAELDAELGATEEMVRLPAIKELGPDVPVTVVLTRHRVGATDRWRSDPESRIVREFDLPATTTVRPSVEVRFDLRASDAVIADFLGAEVATADRRLTGITAAAGWSALDGDSNTAWQSPFAGALGATITVPDVPAGTDSVRIRTVADGLHSRISEVTIDDGVTSRVVPLSATTDRLRFAPTVADGPLTITVTGVEPVTTVDRSTFDVVELPVAIAEIAIQGVAPAVLPDRFATDCRSDLVTIDGEPLAVRVSGETADLLAGRPLTAQPCGDPNLVLRAGRHVVRTTDDPALQIDRVVLASATSTAEATTPPPADLESSTRDGRTATVGPCPDGCWFVQVEGWSKGWTADVDGTDLGRPVPVDGGMSGWWLPPSDTARTITMRWTAQRPVDIAIILTLVSLAIALALLVRDNRSLPRPEPERFSFAASRPAIGRRRAIAWTLVATAAAALAAGLSTGLLLGAALGVGLVVLRRPRLAGVIGLAAVGAIGVVVSSRVMGGDAPADFGFAAHFEDLHRPMIAAVLCVVCSTLCTRDTPPTRV